MSDLLIFFFLKFLFFLQSFRKLNSFFYYYDQDEKYKDSPEYIQYLKYWGGISTEYGEPNAETDWLTLKNYITTNPMVNNANYQTVKSQFNTGSLIDYFLFF